MNRHSQQSHQSIVEPILMDATPANSRIMESMNVQKKFVEAKKLQDAKDTSHQNSVMVSMMAVTHVELKMVKSLSVQ